MTTLLVASNGGHLKQLHHLHRRLDSLTGPFRWATFDTPQSRSLLDGERVDFVPFIGGRDPANVLRNIPYAHRILKGGEVDTVVSTGSAVALPFLAVARSRGIRCHYIESAARLEGPSLTGSLVRGIPGVSLYAQHPRWASGRWSYRGSVFDAFEGVEERKARGEVLAKVVVTLGTYRGVEFSRLIRRLLGIIPAGSSVLWQTGHTDVRGFGIRAHSAIAEGVLSDAMRYADVVVAHAGVGAALAACEVGKCPVLVPRRVAFDEHVDDHQVQIASELAARGLSISVDADELSYDDLVVAAGRSVKMPPSPPAFEVR